MAGEQCYLFFNEKKLDRYSQACTEYLIAEIALPPPPLRVDVAYRTIIGIPQGPYAIR